MDHADTPSFLRRTPLAVCLSAVLAALASGTTAAVPSTKPAGLTVTSCADDGSTGTLRSVVATAPTGATVDLTQLSCGTITLVTGQIDVHVDDLTIDGPGRDALTIDGNYNGRVFHHDGLGTLTLGGLTITHGLANDAANPDRIAAAYGGCILSDNATEQQSSPFGSVALIDSTVSGCRAVGHRDDGAVMQAHGGGVHAQNAVTIQNSTITGCTVENNDLFNDPQPWVGGGGGGVFARYGLVTVTDSVISGNISTTSSFLQMRGGGISAYGGAVVSSSLITDNFVGCDPVTGACYSGLGGGIDVAPGSWLSISASNISANTATGVQYAAGGGVWIYLSTVDIRRTTISGNLASSVPTMPGYGAGGGGLLLGHSNGDVGQISDSTISGNSANYGGGIIVIAGSLTIANTTLSGNVAASEAGAILVKPGDFSRPLAVWNSTITLNSSGGKQGGGGVVDRNAQGPSDLQSSIVAGNQNVDPTATYAADLAASSGTITGANNLIVSADGVTLPNDTIGADPLLGPLQDNGGPTFTHALLADSPAIDTGNNVANLSFDQRGEGFLRVSGRAADIGAFELQQPVADPIFSDGFDTP